MFRGIRWIAVSCAALAACGGSSNDARGTSQAGGNSGVDAGSGGIATSTGGRPNTGGVMPDSGGSFPDSGGTAVGAGGLVGPGGAVGAGSTSPCDFNDPRCVPTGVIPPGPSLCGGVECVDGEFCCLTTLKCEGVADDCPMPEPPPPDPNGRKPCVSNADCPASEFCAANGAVGAPELMCGGAGYCESRTNCGSSGGSLYCGCDGKSYPDIQTACLAGVRAPHIGGCGDTVTIGGGGASGAGVTRTLCGSDEQCPSGERCCALTGYCYGEEQSGLCTYPPPGTSAPCITNADCFSETEFCDSESCGGPGGCRQRQACGALLEPVCGCDGRTYVNAPCAASVGVRVRAQGQCGADAG